MVFFKRMASNSLMTHEILEVKFFVDYYNMRSVFFLCVKIFLRNYFPEEMKLFLKNKIAPMLYYAMFLEIYL